MLEPLLNFNEHVFAIHVTEINLTENSSHCVCTLLIVSTTLSSVNHQNKDRTESLNIITENGAELRACQEIYEYHLKGNETDLKCSSS